LLSALAEQLRHALEFRLNFPKQANLWTRRRHREVDRPRAGRLMMSFMRAADSAIVLTPVELASGLKAGHVSQGGFANLLQSPTIGDRWFSGGGLSIRRRFQGLVGHEQNVPGTRSPQTPELGCFDLADSHLVPRRGEAFLSPSQHATLCRRRVRRKDRQLEASPATVLEIDDGRF
jgi:hypothetical protein